MTRTGTVPSIRPPGRSMAKGDLGPPPLGSRPLERELTPHRERVPFLGQRVELRLQRRRSRSGLPLALELSRELLRPATLRHFDLLDPIPPPDLHGLRRIDG